MAIKQIPLILILSFGLLFFLGVLVVVCFYLIPNMIFILPFLATRARIDIGCPEKSI